MNGNCRSGLPAGPVDSDIYAETSGALLGIPYVYAEIQCASCCDCIGQ